MPAGKAIIVGATSGIGRELAILLSETGFTVGTTGRRFDLLQDMKRLYPENILVSNFDVTQVSEVSVRLDELAGELGGLDLLIISSGIGELNPESRL